MLGLAKSTIHRWVVQLPAIRRPVTCRKACPAAVQTILDIVCESAFSTVKSITHQVADRVGKVLSSSCVRFWMKRHGLSRKKPTHVVIRPGLEQERAAFGRDNFQYIDPERVVSVDESSFYFDMKPGYGYCQRSHRLRNIMCPGVVEDAKSECSCCCCCCCCCKSCCCQERSADQGLGEGSACTGQMLPGAV